MHRILSKVLASFPVPLLSNASLQMMAEKEMEYFEALSLMEAGVELPSHTLLTGAPCRIATLWPIRDYWRKELAFKHELKVTAKERLRRLLEGNVHNWPMKNVVARDSELNKVVVGVHVRRGDFISVLSRRYGDKQLLPPAYYQSALAYYRQRFGREVIFIILTEKSERKWCRNHLYSSFKDVIVADDDASAAQDLVQLSMFEHIIYSHGTYGLWAILLSNATTVVYPDKASDGGLKRYSHHTSLDEISDKVPGTEFVTVTF